MGVAEEWEEMEEYSQQMEQMKRQVSSLTDALNKMQTEKSGEWNHKNKLNKNSKWHIYK